MHLTPVILEAAYTYLRATPPFNKWKLPESDAVEFAVIHSKKYYGYHWLNDDGTHKIQIASPSATSTLIEVVAHEMVHMHQRQSEPKHKASAEHGPKFKRLAAQVCKQHGFDVEGF